MLYALLCYTEAVSSAPAASGVLPRRAALYARGTALVEAFAPVLLEKTEVSAQVEALDRFVADVADEVTSATPQDANALLRHIARVAPKVFRLDEKESDWGGYWKRRGAYRTFKSVSFECLVAFPGIPQPTVDYIADIAARELLSGNRAGDVYPSAICAANAIHLAVQHHQPSAWIFHRHLMPLLEHLNATSRYFEREIAVHTMLSSPLCPSELLWQAAEAPKFLSIVSQSILMNPAAPEDLAVSIALTYEPTETQAQQMAKREETVRRHTHFREGIGIIA